MAKHAELEEPMVHMQAAHRSISHSPAGHPWSPAGQVGCTCICPAADDVAVCCLQGISQRSVVQIEWNLEPSKCRDPSALQLKPGWYLL